MRSQFTSSKGLAISNTLTIVLFLGLLWLPTVDCFLKLDHARAPTENRMPASWPQFKGVGQSRDFITGIENYFNDHFGFRKRLVRWNNHWKHQLFRTSTPKEVLVGREGWLFYSGDRMVEHWTRQATWTEQDLQNWRRLLELRRDWLHQRGIKYLFVVPPDKHTVYPEYLPDWMVKSSKPSKLQQLADFMKTHSSVEFIDLTQSLTEALHGLDDPEMSFDTVEHLVSLAAGETAHDGPRQRRSMRDRLARAIESISGPAPDRS